MLADAAPQSFKRPLRWLWLTLCGVAAGILVLLLASTAVWVEENWRGARHWSACESNLRVQGENLSWEAMIPAPVSAGRNLAMAPLFVREFRYRIDPKSGTYTFGPSDQSRGRLRDMPLNGAKPDYIHPSGAEMARPTDLAGYARYFRENKDFPHAVSPITPAAEILAALGKFDAVLDELSQEAAARPLSRFPLDWYREDVSNINLPHCIVEQGLVYTLRLRSAARLQAGREDEALADLKLALRLSRDTDNEHILIGALTQAATLRMVLSTLWDGLETRRWSPASLACLQAALEHLDLAGNYSELIRHERLCAIKITDHLRNRGDCWVLADPPSLVEHPPSAAMRRALLAIDGFVPPGWYDCNKALMASWIQEYLLGAVNPGDGHLSPSKLEAGLTAINDLPKRPTTMLAKFMMPTMVTATRLLARVRSTLDQAIVACALERSFADHSVYPANLQELVPAYLTVVPDDMISGKPLHYQPTSDGRFRLYCVGWNDRDDGGRVGWKTPDKLENEQGDWVWQYTELQPLPAPKLSSDTNDQSVP